MINSEDEAVKVLRERFPRFQKYVGEDDRMSYDGDEPYLVFGDFAIFLRDKLDKLSRHEISKDDRDLKEAFRLIEEMIVSSRPDLNNLVEVGVLESIIHNPLTIEVARNQFDSQIFQVYESLINQIE